MATGSIAVTELNGNCDKFELTFTITASTGFVWTAFCDKEMSTVGAICQYRAWYFDDIGTAVYFASYKVPTNITSDDVTIATDQDAVNALGSICTDTSSGGAVSVFCSEPASPGFYYYADATA